MQYNSMKYYLSLIHVYKYKDDSASLFREETIKGGLMHPLILSAMFLSDRNIHFFCYFPIYIFPTSFPLHMFQLLFTSDEERYIIHYGLNGAMKNRH